MDIVDRKTRSALMARIRSKDTAPERVVRSLVHRMGFRYRLHKPDLPGRPDIVLSKHNKIILVQGCFWHGHTCWLASKPKSNQSYWLPKIQKNKARDRKTKRQLQAKGWEVLEIWECDIRKSRDVATRLQRFLTRPMDNHRRTTDGKRRRRI